MTGGQYSPTTPTGELGTTAPYGNIDKNFDLCELVKGAGATYTARSTAYHANILINQVKNAINNKGFSFVEALSHCPTYYGRKNKKGAPHNMMSFFKDNSINVKKAEGMSKEELKGKIVIGELYSSTEPEYTEEYQKIIDSFQKER